MPEIQKLKIDSPLGPLWLSASATGLVAITTDAKKSGRSSDSSESELGLPALPKTSIDSGADATTGAERAQRTDENPILAKAATQLREYFAGARSEFDLPLDLRGTEFQTRVWKALREIPFGKTSSYGKLAEKVGSPKGARAVGGANNRNPIPIVVPCHRAVGANGALVGFALGLEAKAKLLSLEKASFKRSSLT